jgi:hypothetical protein
VLFELVLEPELEPEPVEGEPELPAALPVLLLEVLLLDWVSVGLDESVTGVTVCTHGAAMPAVVLVDVGAELGLAAAEVDALLAVGVPLVLVIGVPVTVDDPGSPAVAQAEAVLVPLMPLVAELSVGLVLVIAEAPVDGLRPAPPAVTFW